MTPADTLRRVVAYLRVSTIEQAEQGVSLDAQEAKVRAYCDAFVEDLDLVAVIRDEGHSAKTLDRPGLAQALAMLDNGEADALLVVKLDRLTRSVRDLGELLERYFTPGNVSLLSLSESVDTTTAAGRLVLHMLASVSQWEREVIGERTREALAHLQANGASVGRPGLGWEYGHGDDENGRRATQTIAEEAETVRRIVALRREGLTLRAIAEALTREGRCTKRGGQWAPETVRKVLARAQN